MRVNVYAALAWFPSLLVQTAHVRHHDHPGPCGLGRASKVGGELVSVRGCENEVPMVGGGSSDGRQRRAGII